MAAQSPNFGGLREDFAGIELRSFGFRVPSCSVSGGGIYKWPATSEPRHLFCE